MPAITPSNTGRAPSCPFRRHRLGCGTGHSLQTGPSRGHVFGSGLCCNKQCCNEQAKSVHIVEYVVGIDSWRQDCCVKGQILNVLC